MNNFYNKKGITLIALAVTIIILLILTTVSLNIVSGSSGILNRASNAVEQTEIVSAKEQAELFAIQKKEEYYNARYSRRSVGTTTAKDYLIQAIGEGKQIGSYFITTDLIGNVTIYKGKTSTGPEILTGVINSRGGIDWGEKNSLIPEGLTIGSTVSYEPTGTYVWDKTYATSNETGTLILETGDSVTSGNQDMSVTSWKVLSIDEITGEVELVPATINSNTLKLHGAQGYNNAVQLLNFACESLFSDNDKEITARSINIEDIEKAMTKAGVDANEDGTLDWEKARADYMNPHEGQYGKQMTTSYSSNGTEYRDNTGACVIHRYYPSIYTQEENSVIDTVKNTSSSALDLSDFLLDENDEIKLIGRTENGATSGYLQAQSSIRPYQTYYYFANSDLSNYLGPTYTEILLPNTNSTSYFVASRCVNTYFRYCGFNVRYIISGDLNGCDGFDSGKNSYDYSCPLFPVVTLSALHIVSDGNNFKVE